VSTRVPFLISKTVPNTRVQGVHRGTLPPSEVINAVACQRKQADEISENAHEWKWRNARNGGWWFHVALLHLRPRPSDAALSFLLMVVPSLCRGSAVRGGRRFAHVEVSSPIS